jgi:hypothetical protein
MQAKNNSGSNNKAVQGKVRWSNGRETPGWARWDGRLSMLRSHGRQSIRISATQKQHPYPSMPCLATIPPIHAFAAWSKAFGRSIPRKRQVGAGINPVGGLFLVKTPHSTPQVPSCSTYRTRGRTRHNGHIYAN